MIFTGTCPSGQVILDSALCEAAATALSQSDTTVTTSSSTWSGRPLGCVVSTSSYGSDTLYLQIEASSYDSCSSSNYCLCMPPYGETAPPSPNPTPSPTEPTPIPTPAGYGAKMFLTRSENRWYFCLRFVILQFLIQFPYIFAHSLADVNTFFQSVACNFQRFTSTSTNLDVEFAHLRKVILIFSSW